MAAYQDLIIEQGTDWDDEVLLVDDGGDPIDLTGYTARSSIKRSADDAEALVEMSTDNGRISIGATTGSVYRTLTSSETVNFDWHSGIHDMILISGSGRITRVCAGAVTVLPRLTV